MSLTKIARKLYVNHLIKAGEIDLQGLIANMDRLYAAFLSADEKSRIDICRDLGFVLEAVRNAINSRRIREAIDSGKLKAPGLHTRFEHIREEISEYCWDAGIEIPIYPSRDYTSRTPFGSGSNVMYPVGGGDAPMPEYPKDSWNPFKWPAEMRRAKEIEKERDQREMAARDIWERKQEG